MEKEIRELVVTTFETEEEWNKKKEEIQKIVKHCGKVDDVSEIYNTLRNTLSAVGRFCDKVLSSKENKEELKMQSRSSSIQVLTPFCLVLISMNEEDRENFPLEALKKDTEHLVWLKITDKWSASVTHIVVPLDDEGKASAKNFYVYLGLSAKIYVVSPQWLKHCSQRNTKVMENNFEIRGLSEINVPYHLGTSIRERHDNVFRHSVVAVIKPLKLGVSEDLFMEMLEYLGAMVIDMPLYSLAEDKLYNFDLIICCKDFTPHLKEINKKKEQSGKKISKCPIVHPEWVFTCVLTGRYVGLAGYTLV